MTDASQKMRIDISGMSCEHCVKAVRQALLSVPGVREATVEVGHAEVLAGSAVANDHVVSAVTDAGYKVLSVQR